MHKHKWETTGYNRWMIEIEQKCECGACRHHCFSDMRWKPDGTMKIDWQDGPQPPPMPVAMRK